MSFEALAYIDTLNWKHRASWAVLRIIAEYTFNDSGVCRLGQVALSLKHRSCERTIRSAILKLKDAKIIEIIPRGNPIGGRYPDSIKIVGFAEWLPKYTEGKAAKVAGKGGAGNRQDLPGLTGKLQPGNRQDLPLRCKDSRTNNRTNIRTQSRSRADEKRIAFESEVLTSESSVQGASTGDIRQHWVTIYRGSSEFDAQKKFAYENYPETGKLMDRQRVYFVRVLRARPEPGDPAPEIDAAALRPPMRSKPPP